jgi:hypothetical protein
MMPREGLTEKELRVPSLVWQGLYPTAQTGGHNPVGHQQSPAEHLRQIGGLVPSRID